MDAGLPVSAIRLVGRQDPRSGACEVGFTEPPVSGLGLSESHLRARGKDRRCFVLVKALAFPRGGGVEGPET